MISQESTNLQNDSGKGVPSGDGVIAGRPPAERTIAWFHCFAGIAGDMTLGSLLDVGADLSEVRTLLRRLPLGGWQLDSEPVLRGGIASTRAIVTVEGDVVVRTHSHISGLIEEARLPTRVTTRALAAFAALAAVEARLHRRPVDQVHFHEVGGHDAIVDIVGSAAALEVMGVDEVYASPIATGMGLVKSAHGLLPNPSPAVVALLEGLPTWGRNLNAELTTPTGAALLAAWASGFGPMPAMQVIGQGFGAGARELGELPNCTQVVIGRWIDRKLTVASHRDPASPTEAVIPAGTSGSVSSGPTRESHAGVLEDDDSDAGQPVCLLEANLDDVSGELLATTAQDLLENGAHDVWLSPVIMKKGRPGHVIHVLCDRSLLAVCRSVLRRDTGTFGVRMVSVERWPAARTFGTVWIAGQSLRVKVSADRIKVEHEDAARIARHTGRSIREVISEAESVWRLRGGVGPTPVDDELRPAQGTGEIPDNPLPTGGGSDSDVRPPTRSVPGNDAVDPA